MEFEYFFDTDIEMSHTEKHYVSKPEIMEFFEEIDFIKIERKDGSFAAIGRLKSGRYLEVSYRLLTEEHIYIITAYDIEDPEIRDLLDEEDI